MREVAAGDELIVCGAQARGPETLEELVGPYRHELQLHCYRILGSIQDAEDIVQETLLSAWQALDRFDGHYLSAWLYRIATNRCLNHLRAASRRPRAISVSGSTPSYEPRSLEPDPEALSDDIALGPEARYDARESIALSFVVGLQLLSPRQRGALFLHDVLGFSAAEVANMLDTTTASINSALQRARNRLRPPQDRRVVSLPRPCQGALAVDQFVSAYEQGDICQVVALLTEYSRTTTSLGSVEVGDEFRISPVLYL